MRLKAEREQVGLRMDAIRTRHEEEKKEAKVSPLLLFQARELKTNTVNSTDLKHLR